MLPLWFALCLGPIGIEPARPTDPPKAEGLVELAPSLTMDRTRKEVIVQSQVVLREGALELLLCPVRTKEHESILAADIPPRSFQLALLGIGAKPGSPAVFEPEFHPPTGQKLVVDVEYDWDGKHHRHPARDWIRADQGEGKDPKAMKADFVFAGSRFVRIPGEARARWLGDEGDLICVANFPGAVVDINIASDNANASLLFNAWTDRIPPRGTPVKVIMTLVEDPPAPATNAPATK
ncbi:YdjY domain-containing protein [bacterium]|nr:YdjY domain-containing protein [bacterium]